MRVDFDRRNKSGGSLDIHQNEILPEKRLLLTQSGPRHYQDYQIFSELCYLSTWVGGDQEYPEHLAGDQGWLALRPGKATPACIY